MKNKRPLLIGIVVILAIINIALFAIDRGVSDEDVFPTVIYFTKFDNSAEMNHFKKLVSENEEYLDYVRFRFVNPKNSDFASIEKTYSVNSSSSLLIVSSNGKLIKKFTGIPTTEQLQQVLKQYKK